MIKEIKKFRTISVLLAGALLCFLLMGSIALIGCAGEEDENQDGGSVQEEKILIFNADNSKPLTGKKFRLIDGKALPAEDRTSVALTESEIPQFLQDCGVKKAVLMADSRTVYIPMIYNASEIEEFKAEGYTHLSFYMLVEDNAYELYKNNYIGAISGLLKRSNGLTKSLQFRIDKPTVYDVKIKIEDLISEMTDTSDDSREFATLSEYSVLLCARFWDTGLSFQAMYISDMFLTKETDFIVRTYPALTPGDYI